MSNNKKDRACDHAGIDTPVVLELLLDAGQKLFSVSLAQGLVRGIQPFVIKATDQHWQLGAQLRSLRHRQPIAQRVQVVRKAG